MAIRWRNITHLLPLMFHSFSLRVCKFFSLAFYFCAGFSSFAQWYTRIRICRYTYIHCVSLCFDKVLLENSPKYFRSRKRLYIVIHDSWSRIVSICWYIPAYRTNRGYILEWFLRPFSILHYSVCRSAFAMKLLQFNLVGRKAIGRGGKEGGAAFCGYKR